MTAVQTSSIKKKKSHW